jgi:hypothetical protein
MTKAKGKSQGEKKQTLTQTWNEEAGEAEAKKKADEEANAGQEERDREREETRQKQQLSKQDQIRLLSEGYERGVKIGLEYRPGYEDAKRLAFDDGVRHIVNLAERFLARGLGVEKREELPATGKIPWWWTAALVEYFSERPYARKRYIENGGEEVAAGESK